MTIDEFLRQRIAEDEATARSCPPWPWRVSTLQDETAAHDEQTYADETVSAFDGICVAVPFALSARQTRAVRDHLVAHDPARVLAECAAKRAIVAEHHPVDPCDAHDGATMRTATCDTLLHMASVYADHPDYDEAWRL